MRKAKDSDTMIAVVGGMTAALAAQHALAQAAIRCEIINQGGEDRGCGYGIAFPSAQYGNVRTILTSAHISVRRYQPKE